MEVILHMAVDYLSEPNIQIIHGNTTEPIQFDSTIYLQPNHSAWQQFLSDLYSY